MKVENRMQVQRPQMLEQPKKKEATREPPPKPPEAPKIQGPVGQKLDVQG